MRSETCRRCEQEVRWGWRDGVEGWWHRENVDHFPLFGQTVTPEMWAEIESQLDAPRTRTVTRSKKEAGEVHTWQVEETYTTREHDRSKYSKKKRDALDAEEVDEDDEDEGHDDIEPIEVYATPLDPEGSPKTEPRMPQGVKNVLNVVHRVGWEVIRLNYARGPYLGAKGKSLGVSDSVVLVVRGPVLDSGPCVGVASWRDGKFDWAWQIENNHTTRVGSKVLTTWMKEHPR